MGKATNASNVPHSIVPIIPYTDNKEILKRYLQEYPILPRPPVPLALIHHEIPESHKFMGYFDPPKSRREVLAEERAEADRLEFELTRLAAEAVMERNQRNMEQGRENMKKYKADVVVAGDEEDDEGSDEGQPDRPCNRDSTTGNQVKKNRKNRSIFNQNKNTEEIRAQILKERLNANVCGNTQSTGINGRHKEYSTPFIPLRIGGTIAMEPAERRRVVHGPVFEEHYQDRSDAKSPSKRLSVNWKRSAAVGVKTVDIPIKTLTTSSAISQSNPIESILRQSSIGISNFLMRHTEESDLYEREMNLLKVGEDSETEDLEDYDAEEGILTYASIKDITDRRVKTGDRRRLLDVYMYGLNQQKIPRKTEKTADGEAALKEDEAEENIHAELVAN